MSNVKSTIDDNIIKHQKNLNIYKDVLSKKTNLAVPIIAKIEAESTPEPTIYSVKKITEAPSILLNDLMK